MASMAKLICLALMAGLASGFSPAPLSNIQWQTTPIRTPIVTSQLLPVTGRLLRGGRSGVWGRREPLRSGALGVSGRMEEGVLRSVWRLENPGNLKELQLVQDLLPPPAAGEVRVQIKAVGLNFADVFTCLGMYDAAPRGSPVIPGLEFAGIVEEVGDRISKPKPQKAVQRSADGFKYVVAADQKFERDSSEVKEVPLRPGDRVMGFVRFGAFATHVNVPTYFLRKIPEEWTYEEGASFVVQALTAWYGAVELGHAQKAKSMLIHSAAGGVGLYSLQICKMMGVTPVALVGSTEKADFLRDKFGLSAEQVIVRPWRAAEFKRRLDDSLYALGLRPGFDIIMDSVAGKYFRPGYDSLAPGGRHVLFGAATYTPFGDRGLTWKSFGFWLNIVPTYLSRPKLDVQAMIGENKSVSGFNLIWLTDGRTDPEALGRMLDEILKPSVRWLPPHVGKVFPFDDAVNALRYFKSGKSIGKVILSVGDGDSAKGK